MYNLHFLTLNLEKLNLEIELKFDTQSAFPFKSSFKELLSFGNHDSIYVL